MDDVGVADQGIAQADRLHVAGPHLVEIDTRARPRCADGDGRLVRFGPERQRGHGAVQLRLFPQELSVVRGDNAELAVAAGEQRGIDARRAREGYLALLHLTQEETEGPDTDSSFVRYLRLLLGYPEIAAWDQLWYDGYQDLQKRIYGEVKFLAPDVQVGIAPGAPGGESSASASNTRAESKTRVEPRHLRTIAGIPREKCDATFTAPGKHLRNAHSHQFESSFHSRSPCCLIPKFLPDCEAMLEEYR